MTESMQLFSSSSQPLEAQETLDINRAGLSPTRPQDQRIGNLAQSLQIGGSSGAEEPAGSSRQPQSLQDFQRRRIDLNVPEWSQPSEKIPRYVDADGVDVVQPAQHDRPRTDFSTPKQERPNTFQTGNEPQVFSSDVGRSPNRGDAGNQENLSSFQNQNLQFGGLPAQIPSQQGQTVTSEQRQPEYIFIDRSLAPGVTMEKIVMGPASQFTPISSSYQAPTSSSQILTSEPYIPAREQYIPIRESYTPIQESYIPGREAYIPPAGENIRTLTAPTAQDYMPIITTEIPGNISSPFFTDKIGGGSFAEAKLPRADDMKDYISENIRPLGASQFSSEPLRRSHLGESSEPLRYSQMQAQPSEPLRYSQLQTQPAEQLQYSQIQAQSSEPLRYSQMQAQSSEPLRLSQIQTQPTDPLQASINYALSHPLPLSGNIETIGSTQLPSQNILTQTLRSEGDYAKMYTTPVITTQVTQPISAVAYSTPNLASTIQGQPILTTTPEYATASLSNLSRPRSPMPLRLSSRGGLLEDPRHRAGWDPKIEQNLHIMSQKRCEVHDNKMEYICANDLCIRNLQCFLCLECYNNHPKEHRVFPFFDAFSFEIDRSIQEMIAKLQNAKQNVSTMLASTKNQLDELYHELEQEIFTILLNTKEKFSRSITSTYNTERLRQLYEELEATRLEIFSKNIQEITPYDLQRFVMLESNIFAYLATASTDFQRAARVEEEKHRQGIIVMTEELSKLRNLFKNFETIQNPFEIFQQNAPRQVIQGAPGTILQPEPIAPGRKGMVSIGKLPTLSQTNLSQQLATNLSQQIGPATMGTTTVRPAFTEGAPVLMTSVPGGEAVNLASRVAGQLTGTQPIQTTLSQNLVTSRVIDPSQLRVSQALIPRLEPRIVKEGEAFRTAVAAPGLSRLDIQLWDDPDDTAIEIFESLRAASSLTQLQMVLPTNLSNLGYYLILGAIQDLSNLQYLGLTLQFSEGRVGMPHFDNRDKVMKILSLILPALTNLEILELNITNIEGKISETGLLMVVNSLRNLKKLTRLEFGLALSQFKVISQVSNKLAFNLGQSLAFLPNLFDLQINLGLKLDHSLMCFNFMSELLMTPLRLRRLKINYLSQMKHGITSEEFLQFAQLIKNAGPLEEFTLNLKTSQADMNENSIIQLIYALKAFRLRKLDLSLYRGENVTMLSETIKTVIGNTLTETQILLV